MTYRCFTVTPSIISKVDTAPDLRIDGVGWNGASYNQGDLAYVYVYVKNYGTAASAAGTNVWLMLNGVHVQTYAFPSIAAGNRVNHVFPVETAPLTPGTISACSTFADGTTGTGNSFCSSATVVGLADLNITNFGWYAASYEKGSTAFCYVSVTNSSTTTASAGGQIIYLLLNGVASQQFALQPIAAGSFESHAFSVPTSAIPAGTLAGCVQFSDGTSHSH